MKDLATILVTIAILSFGISSCSTPIVYSNSQPIDHTLWDSQLHDYVDEYGLINYQKWLQDTLRLQRYLDLLRDNYPNDEHWSRDEQMAYWINAYNAFTIELILDYYPLTSIKDIKRGIPFVNSVWDIKFIKLDDTEFDLNNIEHGILRKKWDDPRIHFALVCASLSCPKLQPFAYTAAQLDSQLNVSAKQFLQTSFRNDIQQRPVKLSKILSWYWTDFKDHYDGRYALVNKYTDVELDQFTPIEFMDYNWGLNEQTEQNQQLVKQ